MPSKASVQILETLNGWYKIKYNNLTGYVSSQYVSVNTSSDTSSSSASTQNKVGTVTASSSLNIRSGAGTNYSIIGSLPSKASVQILETLNGWYKIKYNNLTGYVSSQYVSVNTSSDTSLNSPSTQNKVGTVTASPSLNIRSGAGTNYSIIGSLPSKASVQILETLNGWYKIKYNNLTGYVSSQYVSV